MFDTEKYNVENFAKQFNFIPDYHDFMTWLLDDGIITYDEFFTALDIEKERNSKGDWRYYRSDFVKRASVFIKAAKERLAEDQKNYGKFNDFDNEPNPWNRHRRSRED